MCGVLCVVVGCGYDMFGLDFEGFVCRDKVVVFFDYVVIGDDLFVVGLFIVVDLNFVFDGGVCYVGGVGYGLCYVGGVDIVIGWVE